MLGSIHTTANAESLAHTMVNMESVAHFKRVKRRSLAKEIVKVEEREKEVTKRNKKDVLSSTSTFERHSSTITGVTVAEVSIHQLEIASLC